LVRRKGGKEEDEERERRDLFIPFERGG